MITLEKIEAIGHQLPPERTNPAPGFVCLYTAPDGEHCIIGEICQQLGLPVPLSDDDDNRVAVGYLATSGRWSGRLTPAAIVWAAQAQLLGQMGGYPWAVCVASADNSVAPMITLPQLPGSSSAAKPRTAELVPELPLPGTDLLSPTPSGA